MLDNYFFLFSNGKCSHYFSMPCLAIRTRCMYHLNDISTHEIEAFDYLNFEHDIKFLIRFENIELPNGTVRRENTSECVEKKEQMKINRQKAYRLAFGCEEIAVTIFLTL